MAGGNEPRANQNGICCGDIAKKRFWLVFYSTFIAALFGAFIVAVIFVSVLLSVRNGDARVATYVIVPVTALLIIPITTCGICTCVSIHKIREEES